MPRWRSSVLLATRYSLLATFLPAMNLKPETLSKIDEVITHYPTKRSATLPLLHLIQEDVGYIPGRHSLDLHEARDSTDQRFRGGHVLPDVSPEAYRPAPHQGLSDALLRAGRWLQ